MGNYVKVDCMHKYDYRSPYMPKKAFCLQDNQETHEYAVFSRSMVEEYARLFDMWDGSKIPDSICYQAAVKLTGMYVYYQAYDYGYGRGFATYPTVRVGKHHVVVYQYRSR